jgi:hydroxyacylglutathione hydrolase
MLHTIQLLSQRTDNTFYLVHDGARACLIDPIDAPQAIARIRELGLTLDALLNTHWHPDHVGGNAEILAAFPSVSHLIPAGEADRIQTDPARKLVLLAPGDVVRVGQGELQVILTPGHTVGHISLVGEQALLCGDVIFSAGVGHCKLGGDPPTLARTFSQILPTLPEHLTICCGHDYARRNVLFGLSLLPADPALLAHQARLAAHGEGPLPTTLGEERAMNPFMRCAEPAVQQAARAGAPQVWEARRAEGLDAVDATFCALRALRDVW